MAQHVQNRFYILAPQSRALWVMNLPIPLSHQSGRLCSWEDDITFRPFGKWTWASSHIYTITIILSITSHLNSLNSLNIFLILHMLLLCFQMFSSCSGPGCFQMLPFQDLRRCRALATKVAISALSRSKLKISVRTLTHGCTLYTSSGMHDLVFSIIYCYSMHINCTPTIHDILLEPSHKQQSGCLQPQTRCTCSKEKWMYCILCMYA